MKTAFSYVRFSRPEQLKGDSLRRQVEATKAFCERHGLTLDESLTLQDLGVSAFRGKNAVEGSLKTFLVAVEAGTVPKGSTLVVEALDRLSRNEILEALPLFLGILKSGIAIATLINGDRIYTKESVTQNPFELVMVISELVSARGESVRKSERVAAAWAKKRASAMARPLTARCPRWLTLKEDKFTPIPKRVAVLKRIVKLGIEGLGPYRLTEILNVEGVPSFGRKPKWDYGTVSFTLRNRALIGEYQPKIKDERGRSIPIGDPVQNYYPSVIPRADFDRLQAVLSRRRASAGQGGRKAGGRVGSNIFGKLLHSMKDDSRLIIRERHGKRTLISFAYLNGLSEETQAFTVDDFEKHFLLWVSELNLEDFRPVNVNGEERLTEVRQRIQKVEKQLRGEGDFDRWLRLLKDLESEERRITDELQRRNEPLLIDAARDIGKLYQQMEAAPLNARLAYRARLRTRILPLVKSIRLWIDGTNIRRICIAEVGFADGKFRWLAIRKDRGEEAQSCGTLEPVNEVRIASKTRGECESDVTHSLSIAAIAKRMMKEKDIHPKDLAESLDAKVGKVRGSRMEIVATVDGF